MSCILIANNVVLNCRKIQRLKQALQLLLLVLHQQGTQLVTPTSPMTRQRAAAIAIASTPPSASTRSKTAAPSPLR